MLCHRGCGLAGVYINTRGKSCCNKTAQKCPIVKQKIGKSNSVALKGRTLLPSQVAGLAKGRTGRKPSASTIDKISNGNKEWWTENTRDPWNKGLTKEDDRVASYANAQKGTTRTKRIKVIESSDPIYNDIKKYRNRIAVRTGNTYEENKDKINPDNLPLGKAGISGAYHLDHIMSVREGFTYSVPVELMASADNLRIIPWQENLTKYSKVDYSIIPKAIQTYLKENKCATYY